jgi:hypothetical protein
MALLEPAAFAMDRQTKDKREAGNGQKETRREEKFHESECKTLLYKQAHFMILSYQFCCVLS